MPVAYAQCAPGHQGAANDDLYVTGSWGSRIPAWPR